MPLLLKELNGAMSVPANAAGQAARTAGKDITGDVDSPAKSSRWHWYTRSRTTWRPPIAAREAPAVDARVKSA
jgi:hypothetical protein